MVLFFFNFYNCYLIVLLVVENESAHEKFQRVFRQESPSLLFPSLQIRFEDSYEWHRLIIIVVQLIIILRQHSDIDSEAKVARGLNWVNSKSAAISTVILIINDSFINFEFHWSPPKTIFILTFQHKRTLLLVVIRRISNAQARLKPEVMRIQRLAGGFIRWEIGSGEILNQNKFQIIILADNVDK